MDMLQAFNTGHDGSLSTGHANSAKDMLLRLEAMVLMGTKLPIAAIRRQISTGIDLIVHLERGRSGRRRVVEILEILGMEQEEIKTRPVFVLKESAEGAPRLVQVENNVIRRRGYVAGWEDKHAL